MVLTFERPVGAAADAKELEYITALHQTSDVEDDTFLDGSIEANDVKYYLISRYGIEANLEDIRNSIFKDLAGGSSDDECLDICEMVAILLIPFFAECIKGDLDDAIVIANAEGAFTTQRQLESYICDLQKCKSMVSKSDVLDKVLKIILADSTGSTEPQKITPELIKIIFARYGESSLIEDEELIQEMVADVSGGDPDAVLDAETFCKALANDVLLYDVEKEARVSTIYEDVFGMEGEEEEDGEDLSDENNIKKAATNDGTKNGNEPTDVEDTQPLTAAAKLRKILTFSQVDGEEEENVEDSSDENNIKKAATDDGTKNGNESTDVEDTQPPTAAAKLRKILTFSQVDGEEEEDGEDPSDENNIKKAATDDGTKNGNEPTDVEDAQPPTAAAKLRKILTFSQVDFFADTMRSKTHLIIVYITYVFSVYIYAATPEVDVCPNLSTKSFGCKIANSTLLWLLIMSLVVATSVPWIFTLSCGNTLRGSSYISLLFGVYGIINFLIIPFWVPFDNMVLKSKDNEDDNSVTFRQISFGFYITVLIGFQILHLIRSIKPTIYMSKNRIVSTLFTRGTVRETFLLKRASSMKTFMLVKNALDLHDNKGKNVVIRKSDSNAVSTSANALLNYSKETEKTESVGGLIWCWKSFFTRSLIHREGLMINSRLILCNILQFMLALVLCFVFANSSTLILRLFYDSIYDSSVQHEVKDCSDITFDPSECYWPSAGKIPSGMAVCPHVNVDGDGSSCLSEKYSEPIYALNPPEYNPEVSLLCYGIEELIKRANFTAWSLIFAGKASEKFLVDSMEVVDYGLCEGLQKLDDTIWSAISNTLEPFELTSCEITSEKSFSCAVDVDEKKPFDSMTALLLSYEEMYKDTLENTINCLESNLTNVTIVDDIFAEAAECLKASLRMTSEASWITMYDGINVRDAINDGKKVAIDMLHFWGITTVEKIFDVDELVNSITVPVFGDFDTISKTLLVESAVNLVESVFDGLNNTLNDAKIALDSDLEILPSNVKMPNLTVVDFCQGIRVIRENVTLFVDTAGSTEDYYCRAHLTACTLSGFCVLGIGRVGPVEYFPYQFSGPKCYDEPELERLMEVKSMSSLSFVQDYIPSPIVVKFALATAIFVSILFILGIASLFIPHVILTALKYRSGVLPSLRDKNFKKRRSNLSSITFLMPVAFWSALLMTFMVFLIILLAAFILFWEKTRRIVIEMIGLVTGVAITLTIKMVTVYLIEKYNYAAFYRKNPIVVNTTSVALECWHVFLAIPFVISRAAILIATSVLFIGRVDRTVLAEDIDIDRYPHVFRQVILVSDAHRHPYIERLGMMYLMKLKHGASFGKRSNSTWRLLFVFALMPWLQKYRIAEDIGDIDGEKLTEAYEMVKKKNDEVNELKNVIKRLSVQLDKQDQLGEYSSSDYQSTPDENKAEF